MTTRRKFLETGACGLFAGYCAQLGHADDSRQLPKALLLGDSISMGYTNYVTGILLKTVQVERPQNENGMYLNCEGTTRARSDLETWLGDKLWDVIHFNFGLHDLKHVDPITGRNSRNPDDPLQADLKQYAANLGWIVGKLKATGSKLIFATTTPYPENPGGPLRDAGLSKQYNEVALPIMRRHDVAINDLYSLVLPKLNELMPSRNVHFKPAGSLLLAQAVAEHIHNALATPS